MRPLILIIAAMILTQVSQAQTSPDTTKNKTYSIETLPEFPGGVPALRAYLARNIKYPVEAMKDKAMGTAVVQFDVTENGSIVNAVVKNPIHHAIDREALRVIRTMPKWKPGMQDGKPIKVQYAVPISFSLR